MKKLSFFISLFFVFTITGNAQVPEAFNYQAVVRNASGEIIANTVVSLKISILQDSETGVTIYSETHSEQSNQFGLVNLKIGKGSKIEGVFSPDNWGEKEHFLKIEFDPDGGSSFTPLGTSKFSAVPYAFHAQTVAIDETEDADADPNNEIQEIQISGTQLTLSKGGGTVTLPSSGSGGDNWGTQTVTSDATLSGRGTEADPLKVESSSLEPEWSNIANKPAGFADGEDDVNDDDADPDNELQTLSISGNDLSISDGNTVSLPESASSVWNKLGDNVYFSGGKVGIGIDSPEEDLVVHTGSAPISSIAVQTDASGSSTHDGLQMFIGATNEGNLVNYENANLNFGTNNSIDMTITTDGRLGIGTTNPSEKLQIKGGNIILDKGFGYKISNNNGYSEIKSLFGDDLSIVSYSGDDITFFTSANSGGTATSRLTIDNNGKVGIGTAEPQEILHVRESNPRILIEATSSNPEINFKNAEEPNSSAWAIYKKESTGDLMFYQNGDKLTLQKNTGNIGIGTTNPQGKLDVNGSIYQRGGQLHADYVFDENYQLESIEEHAEFMWKNKHLPAIPKAKTDENGFEVIEVGSHRKGIVEELEKAHIYIHQLENKLSSLEKRLSELESFQQMKAVKQN